MKVFISSVISGFEEIRDSAESAIKSLGHEVVRAEDFPASDESSRVACLSGVRSSDLVLLILGERYGMPLPPADVSPTHEEFLEAKGCKPILVFVQTGVDREALQNDFVALVESWDEGRHRRAFGNPDELRSEVTRAIHEYELRTARAPFDSGAALKRALELVKSPKSQWGTSAHSKLKIALVGGPQSQILRPRELENSQLEDDIAKMLLFGPFSMFDRGLGMTSKRSGEFLFFSQNDGRDFAISEQGDIIITIALIHLDGGIPSVIVENVEESIERSLRLASDVLHLVDSSNRLSRCIVAMRASGAEFTVWRSRAEHKASPNSVTHTAFFGGQEPRPVTLSPPDIARAAVSYDAHTLAEDFTALLQREASGEGTAIQ